MKKVYNLIVIFLFMCMFISCRTLNKSINTNSEEKTLNSLYSEVEKDVIFMRDTMHKKACGFFHFVTEESYNSRTDAYMNIIIKEGVAVESV